MELKSSAYQEGEAIPERYTCDGEDISPGFSWDHAPDGTRSFALLIHDRDASHEGGGFTHWALYDIPPDVRSLHENIAHGDTVPGLGMQGCNDGGSKGYMGPCPPSGTHRYIASLYALDTKLRVKPGSSRREVESAMEGHILDFANLTGTYSKKRPPAR